MDNISPTESTSIQNKSSQPLLEAFFLQSLNGCFFMMLDEPVWWNDTVNKDKVLDYVFTHQRITKINQTMLNQYLAVEDQFLGLTPSDLFAHDIEYGRDLWIRLFNQGRVRLETDERKFDDTPMWIEGEYVCLYDEQGRITGHFGIQREITERKQTEEALQKSNLFIQSITETTPHIIYVFNILEQRNTYINKSLPKLLGYSDEEAQKFTPGFPLELLHPDDLLQLEQTFNRWDTAKTNGVLNVEYRMKSADGTWRWFIGTDTVFSKTDDGRVEQIIGTAQDITERKHTEQALRQSEATNNALINAIPDLIFRVARDGTNIEVVPSKYVPTIFPVEEMIGKSLFDILPANFAQERLRLIQQALQTGVVQTQEYQLPISDKIRFEEARIVACGDDEVIIIIRDITDRKQAEESQKTYAAELERSNKELQEFAYIASHDLQEPLRKVKVFGDRLKTNYSNALDEKGLDYLERMQSAATRMQTLIEDLLVFSRVTTRAQPFTPINLNEIIKGVLSDLETRIEATQAQIEVADLPVLEADETQMRQLFQNLISNALKFHKPNTPPKIKIALIERNSESCKIAVSDNGIGFNKKHYDHIFGVFHRLHRRNEYPGTGVGLAVCRKITNRHNGTIEAKSVVGQGATFLIILPLKQPKE